MLHGVADPRGESGQRKRPEIFAPFSLVWASEGVAVRAEHRGVEVTRAIPTRASNGEISIATPAPPALVAAYNEGRKFLSIEFHAVQETRNKLRACGKSNRHSYARCVALVADRLSTHRQPQKYGSQASGGCGYELALAVKPEVRSANYADQVIAQIMSHASGASDGGALAVIEASARIWASWT